MKRTLFMVIGSSVMLAGCGQSSDNNAANEAAGNSIQPPKKSAYCFFKDDEMKDWKASRDDQGNIRIEGKAHVKDPRYKATAGQTAVGPKKAILFPTITQNDTGYATPDNWWDIAAVLPNSASVNEAVVQCGDKTVADIQVPPKG